MVLKQNLGYKEGVSMIRDTSMFLGREERGCKEDVGIVRETVSGLNWVQFWLMQKKREEVKAQILK